MTNYLLKKNVYDTREAALYMHTGNKSNISGLCVLLLGVEAGRSQRVNVLVFTVVVNIAFHLFVNCFFLPFFLFMLFYSMIYFFIFTILPFSPSPSLIPFPFPSPLSLLLSLSSLSLSPPPSPLPLAHFHPFHLFLLSPPPNSFTIIELLCKIFRR